MYKQSYTDQDFKGKRVVFAHDIKLAVSPLMHSTKFILFDFTQKLVYNICLLFFHMMPQSLTVPPPLKGMQQYSIQTEALHINVSIHTSSRHGVTFTLNINVSGHLTNVSPLFTLLLAQFWF